MSNSSNFVEVSIKWQKKLYKNVKINLSKDIEIFELFQAQIYSLTSIPIDNQKILIKGKRIKNDADCLKYIKNGKKILLMGNINNLKQPDKKISFVEDLTDHERASLIAKDNNNIESSGLINLGNTCYMNSTIQNLRNIPELKQQLITFLQQTNDHNLNHPTNIRLTKALAQLLIQLDNSITAINPLIFTSTLRAVYPQFDQRDSSGHYAQQDADECISQILTSISKSYKNETKNNPIHELFTGQYQVSLKNTENEVEDIKITTETFMKLQCFITSNVNYLSQGLSLGLTTTLEKFSHTLNRNSIYEKTLKIVKLPQYLIIHFVRFGWKNVASSSSSGGGGVKGLSNTGEDYSSGVKTKKLRKIIFPEKLDISEYCESKLSNILKASQMKLKQEENKKLALGKYSQEKNKKR